MDELLTHLKSLNSLMPHNVLCNLFFGAAVPSGVQTQFFDRTSRQQYNLELPLDEMTDVDFSDLDIENTFTHGWEWRTGNFYMKNLSDKPKRITMEIFLRLCRVTKIANDIPRCRYTDETPLVTPARVIILNPHGYQKIEFEYQTPPAPAPDGPYFEDITNYRVEVHMIDEVGNKAVLRDVVRYVSPP